jgi:hypothetical protein
MPTAKKKPPSEKAQLVEKISRALKIPAGEVELRALREMAQRLAAPAPKAVASKPPPAERHSALPQRLYLLLDGRGLDGRGMPIEVIDLPCILGSEKKSNVWINSPQIETHHARITQDGDRWVIEDLGSQHGTFFGDKQIKRRMIENGDEYRLAGYLRVRTELR